MTALVTIGVPVFNGAATLEHAVESAIRQTVSDCIVIISDNASTDETKILGPSLARKYPNVSYIRHDAKLRVSGNFTFVLDQAKTPYFMWLAADDFIQPTYVEKTLAALQANPDWVACSSRVLIVTSDGRERAAEGTYALLDDRDANLVAYLSNPTDNSRAYALHRTEALKKAHPRVHFHAFDLSAMVGTIMSGKYGEIDETLMIRDETPSINYFKRIPRDNNSALTRVFPMLPLSKDIIIRLRLPIRPRFLAALFALNLDHHLRYMEVFHPKYIKVTKPLWEFWRQYVAWRLRAKPKPSYPPG